MMPSDGSLCTTTTFSTIGTLVGVLVALSIATSKTVRAIVLASRSIADIQKNIDRNESQNDHPPPINRGGGINQTPLILTVLKTKGGEAP